MAIQKDQLVGFDGDCNMLGDFTGADAKELARRGVAQWGDQCNRIVLENAPHPVCVNAPYRATVQIVHTVVNAEWFGRDQITAQYSESCSS